MTRETAIYQLLKDLGVPATVKGYQGLKVAIDLVLRESDLTYSITKGLYPKTAAVLQDTPSRVERAIRHAVELAFDRGDLTEIYRVLGNTVSFAKSKSTNGEFIVGCAEYLRHRYPIFEEEVRS